MGTFSTTTSNTFTLTHAKRIASKVATDLMRFRRYYGKPALSSIDEYEEELVVLLKHDVLKEVAYGFRKNGKWITAIKYQAIDGQLIADDNPGSLRAVSESQGATFYSFLSYNAKWDRLTTAEKDGIRKQLPFKRGTATEPTVDGGYWVEDLAYSAGGRGLRRSKIKRYS